MTGLCLADDVAAKKKGLVVFYSQHNKEQDRGALAQSSRWMELEWLLMVPATLCEQTSGNHLASLSDTKGRHSLVFDMSHANVRYREHAEVVRRQFWFHLMKYSETHTQICFKNTEVDVVKTCACICTRLSQGSR